jgi:7-cyano-7-deazaguanine synthase
MCILVSGGLDSCVLLAEVASGGQTVWPVYIRQGLAWEEAELYWLKTFLRRIRQRSIQSLHVFTLPMADLYGKHWSTGGSGVPGPRSKDSAVYLPGRNLTLSVKAAIFAATQGISKIAIGSLGHNPFPDASPHFLKHWSKALSMGLAKPVQLVAPYRRTQKWELIRRAQGWPIQVSFSCISPRGLQHCGHCNKCVERKRAFKKAGVWDETQYVKD